MKNPAQITACGCPKDEKKLRRNEIKSPSFSAFIRISPVSEQQSTKNARHMLRCVISHHADETQMSEKAGGIETHCCLLGVYQDTNKS